jgi:rubrerythrin
MTNSEKEMKMECALCGFTANGKFVGDICPQCNMTYWKCSECGYTITAANFPETWPSCHNKCDFRNITCYTPECGGPGHIDPRL